jgi:purine-cytosine permease-like protein
MAWAGWGAGAAGAGSAGGPSRGFLAAMVIGAALVTVALALERSPLAFAAGTATAYFLLRLTGRIGPRRGS